MTTYLRDLNSTIPGTKNFTYGEFVKSDTALRLGIVNNPGESEWLSIEKLAVNVLQPVRDKFGRLRITSGYRCVELCNAVGSGSTSNHVRGEAADFEPIASGIKMIKVFEWIANNLYFRELILEYAPSGWTHVAYRENGNDKIIKLKDSTHNYTVMTLKEIMRIYG